MHFNYDPAEWSSLPAKDRVRRCRLWAAEARTFALQRPGQQRALFLSVADGWDKLAQEIEQEQQCD